jgi:formate hydrogenlyase transcriptional activator
MERATSLEILHNITKLVVRELNTSKLISLIAEELKPRVDFDRMSITIYNEKKDMFELRAIALEEDSKLIFKGSFPRKGSRAGLCLRHGKTIYFPDLAVKKEFFETNYLIDEGYLSGLCIPLVVGQRKIGTLNFNAKRVDPFAQAQISFLEWVAEPVAIAMGNALSFEELNKVRDQLARENRYLIEESKGGLIPSSVVGSSRVFRHVLAQAEKVAFTDATVLLSGETGTGKELMATLIHEKSSRANKPLVKVNCAAVPNALLETEFFGHVRGAFTGAVKNKVGRFEVADGGTLFLDEISGLSLELQAKLLRVIQDREITRIGSNFPKPVDFRLVVASNADLMKEVKEVRFRKDLFFRLNVFPIELPPLRARKDDLADLVEYFTKRLSLSLRKSFRGMAKGSMDLLRSYSWPGNIRELENVLERACIVTPNDEMITISSHMLTFQDQETNNKLGTLKHVEREHIIRVLSSTNGRIDGKGSASEILALHPNTLRSRMKKLGITVERKVKTAGQSSSQNRSS